MPITEMTNEELFEIIERHRFFPAGTDLDSVWGEIKKRLSKPRPQELPPSDPLAHLFQLQAGLNARCGVSLHGLSEKQKIEWVLNYSRAMQQELAELVDSVPWKWWAKYQKFDEQNGKVEVVDLFHFLISLAQVYGMSSQDVYEAYLKKNQVNHARQDTGYAVKDETDSKHI